MGVTPERHADHALAWATVYALVVWNVVVTAVLAFQTGRADGFSETYRHFMPHSGVSAHFYQRINLRGNRRDNLKL
jgi:hypothetical protein